VCGFDICSDKFNKNSNKAKMVIIGYILLIGGFLSGAFVSVLDTTEVNWPYFATSISVGVLGVVLIRIAHHQKHRSTEAVEQNIQAIFDSLKRVAENMRILITEARDISPYDIRHRVDELFADDLDTFVQARKSIAHVYSLQDYADVMSHFAAGERYLNRVWSASADGYIDEVNAYLDKAQTQFTSAFDKIQQLKK
jgi:hypothetical protein